MFRTQHASPCNRGNRSDSAGAEFLNSTTDENCWLQGEMPEVMYSFQVAESADSGNGNGQEMAIIESCSRIEERVSSYEDTSFESHLSC